MKQLVIFLLIVWLSVAFFSCQEDTIEVLPPATQEGKKTFGCLVNGKVWLPKGNNGTSNLDLSYDPGYKGGSFNISAYRIEDNIHQFMVFGGNGIHGTGSYPLTGTEGSPGALFTDHSTKCSYDYFENIVTGKFVITKLDLENQIISGAFEFTLAKGGCDTIRVTDGRFDLKI